MARSNNARSSSLPPAYQKQAQEEINQIKALLKATKFKTVGWLAWSISPLATSVPVPKTVYDAYNELIKYEKTDPMKALALYYAHFYVAIRPEHDHVSRQEETRQFYKSLTEKKGNTIFPNEPDTAALFDTFLKAEIDALILKRSPEQKAYLDFHAKVQTEINHIQSMVNALTALQTVVSLEKKPELDLEITFLSKVMDRMRMAGSRDDVISYSKDALMVLNSISVRILHQDQMRTLRECITQFQYHHCNLMTDLADKKNALYFSAAFQTAAVAISTPLAHMVSIPSLSIFSGIPDLNILEKGVTSATSAALEKVGKKDEEKKQVNPAVLHHIYDATKKETSLTDKYVNTEKSLIATIKNPETKEKMTRVAAIAVAVFVFPYLAVPAAVLLTLIAAGGVAYNLFLKHDELAAAEKNSKTEKELHESEMHIYRKQAAGTYSKKKVARYWNDKNQTRQQGGGTTPTYNAVYVDPTKKNKT